MQTVLLVVLWFTAAGQPFIINDGWAPLGVASQEQCELLAWKVRRYLYKEYDRQGPKYRVYCIPPSELPRLLLTKEIAI